MALLDLAVYNNFKFFFAVSGFALYVQTITNRVFIPFYGHYIPAMRAFYFHPFGVFGLQNIELLSKKLEKILNVWYNYKKIHKGDFYMKSSTLRTITIVVAVLGLIGGVVLGFKFKTVDVNRFYTTEHFNTILMLSSWIGTALYVIPCLAIASVLDNQDMIMSELWKQSQTVKNVSNEMKSANSSGSSHVAPPPVRNTSDTWTCSNCGERNPRNARICKSCGQDK